MTQAEVNSYRRQLLALKKRLGGDLTDLEKEALRPVGGDSSGNLSDVPHRDRVVRALQEIEVHASDHGRVDGAELETLRRLIYDGKIDREKDDFLVEIHKRVRNRTPAFEHFFSQAIKDYILADGGIDAAEAAWLRELLFADGKIDDEERRFIHELKGEAKEVSPEFEALFKEVMKQPMERHTAG